MGFLDRIAGRFDELVAGESDTQVQSREDVELARALADRGSLDDAVAAFGRAVDLDASNAEAWLGMGEALGALGRFEPARDAFRRALTLTLAPERRARAQSALGRLYAGAGQTGKAIRELRKAAGALPDDVDTLTALGRALITADDAAEGEGSEWLARAARLPGGDPHLLREAAQARSKTDAAAGERLLREATARAPGDARIRAALARHLAAVGDLAAALREAATAAGALPEDPDVWGALREVQAAAANYPAAIEAARREAERGSGAGFFRLAGAGAGRAGPRAG